MQDGQEPGAKVVGIRTLADIPPEKVLSGAHDADLSCVLVLGFTADGELYAAGSTGCRATNVHLCETFKHALLSGQFGEPVIRAF